MNSKPNSGAKWIVSMPDAIPFRLAILKEIEVRLARVNPTNGYISDLSGPGAVETGRLWLGDSDPVPMVTVVEPPLVIEQARKQKDNPNRATEWDLIVQGWVEVSRKKPIDGAYIMAAEIGMELTKVLKERDGPGSDASTNFLGFGPRIQSFLVGSPVVRPPEHASANAQFYLILNMQIVEDMAKPFG